MLSPFMSSKQLIWISDYNGNVPSHAVAGGTYCDGEPNYIGRAQFGDNGDLIPGCIVPSHGVIYFVYEGKEHYLTEYQCLIHPDGARATSFNWLSTIDIPWIRGQQPLPKNAVIGGREKGGQKLFIGRAYYQGGWVIGKIQMNNNNTITNTTNNIHTRKNKNSQKQNQQNPSHQQFNPNRTLYIPFGGQQVVITDHYDVLVLEK